MLRSLLITITCTQSHTYRGLFIRFTLTFVSHQVSYRTNTDCATSWSIVFIIYANCPLLCQSSQNRVPTTYVSVEEQGVVCWPSNWRFHYGWHLLRHAVYLLTSCTSAWTHHQHSNRVYRPPAVCPKRWMMWWPSSCPWAPGHLEMPHRKKEKIFKES